MLSLQGAIVTEIEISAPIDKFYNIFKIESHKITNASQTGVHDHEGYRETEGSIKIWNYSIGEAGVLKERIEYDEANKAVIVTGIEGDPFKYYKALKGIYEFIHKDDGNNIAKLTIEYEKLSDEVADPDKYVVLMTDLVKKVDSHFIKA